MLEAAPLSSGGRLTPSPGVQGSYGILRRPRRPRMHKPEHERRLRGSRILPSDRRTMRFVGIEPHQGYP